MGTLVTLLIGIRAGLADCAQSLRTLAHLATERDARERAATPAYEEYEASRRTVEG